MTSLTRIAIALAVAAGLAALPLSPAMAQIKPANGNKPEPAPKPDPIVIKLQKAEKGRLAGQEVMVITGTDMLTGKFRTFGVENERPQNPNDKPKYDPRARIADAVKPLKEGDLLKIEIKSNNGGNMGYGGGGGSTEWVDRAEAYKLAAGEEKPGAFILFDSYIKQEGGQDVYIISLYKLGRYFDCYAQMVTDETGKKLVPDPVIVKIADAVKKKEVVEANINPMGKLLLVTSIDPYQEPKTGKFVKLTDADVNGQKGHAVEIEESGKSVTLLIPGRLAGKRYTEDLTLLSEAKRTKPGAPVVFRTRDYDGKEYIRQLTPGPKEAKPAKETKASK